MRHDYKYALILGAIGLIAGLGGLLGNVASSQVPGAWNPYLWLAWPLFFIFILLGVGLAIWQRKLGPPAPEVGGLNTERIRELLRDDILPKKDEFEQRKELSEKLWRTSWDWAKILLTTFENAVLKWCQEGEGRQAAEAEIMAQDEDFTKLDYWSLRDTSPIITFLRQDVRFAPFADNCAEFYESALSVKRLVYGNIKASPQKYVTIHDVGIETMVKLWKQEVEQMLERVTVEYHKIQTFKKQ